MIVGRRIKRRAPALAVRRGRHEHLLSVRKALTNAWNSSTESLAEAFHGAGVDVAHDLATYAMNGCGAGNSVIQGQALRELFGGEPRNDHARASNEYRCMDIHAFQNAMETAQINEALLRLQRYPPDNGRVIYVGDGHLENYKCSLRAKELDDGTLVLPGPGTRAATKVRNTKGNARSRDADPFLGVGIVWEHDGRSMSAVVSMTFLHGFQPHSKEYHVQKIVEISKLFPYQAVGMLLDAWYDAATVRRLSLLAGMPVQTRMAFTQSRARHIWIDGERRDLREIVKATVKDKSIPTKRIARWGPDGALTRESFKIIRIAGILGADDPGARASEDAAPTQVELQVAVKRHENGRMAPIWGLTSAVSMHGPANHDMEFCYYLRWSIETLFQVLVDVKGRTCEQMVNRKIVNVLLWTYLMTRFVTLREQLAETMPSLLLAGKPLILVSIRSLMLFAFVKNVVS